MEKNYLTQSEFSRLCKVSRQAVSKGIKYDRIILNSNKIIDLNNCLNNDFLIFHSTIKTKKSEKMKYISKKYKCKDGYKYCPACKTEKLMEEFYHHKNRKNGLTVYCKACYTLQKNEYNSTENAKIVSKNYSTKQRELLTDRYIKGLLHTKTGIVSSMVTPELIELQRTVSTIKRKIKQRKTA